MANVALAYGGFYFSTAATTTLAAATPVKGSGTTTALPLSGFTMPASNRLTYTGTATRVFFVQASISASTISGAETCQFYLYLNGTVIAGSEIERKVSNNDIGALGLSTLVSMDEDDYVEVWVASTGGDDINIGYGSLSATVAG